MTGGLALSAAMIPTLTALAVMGLADPKRRRTGKEPQVPTRWRSMASMLLLATGILVVGAAGFVALLIWASAVTVVGWALSQGLAVAPVAVRGRADAVLGAMGTSLTGRHPAGPHPGETLSRASPRRAWIRDVTGLVARGRAVQLGLLLLALLCAAGTLSAWRAASGADMASRRLVALQAIGMFDAGRAARAAMQPCLKMLAGAPDGGILRDLLSDRAITVAVADGASHDAATDVQRCILSHGGDGASVARDRAAASTSFTIDPDVVAAVHAAITGQLTLDETMVELAADDAVSRGLICRHVLPGVTANVWNLIAALRRDRAYAKAEDLLLRLPDLDRPAGDGPGTPPCAS